MTDFSTKARIDYKGYLQSFAWKIKKNEWVYSGRPLECWACGRLMSSDRSGFNFHHRTYKNLGDEQLDDLVLLCMFDHEQLSKEWLQVKFVEGHCLHNHTHIYVVSNRLSSGLSTQANHPVMKYLGAYHE